MKRRDEEGSGQPVRLWLRSGRDDAVGTILDDEPRISISNYVGVDEGDTGTTGRPVHPPLKCAGEPAVPGDRMPPAWIAEVLWRKI